jgi:hypothetical protein
MLGDLVLIGLVVRAVVTAASHGRERRKHGGDEPPAR